MTTRDRRRARCRGRRELAGFTLVELMISLVLFSVAVAGILSVAVSLVQGYRETRSAIATESAARAPVDFLADSIRQALPAVSTGQVFDANEKVCANVGVVVTNSTTDPDRLDFVYAAGAVVTSLAADFTGSGDMEVVTAEGFTGGDAVILTDLETGHLVPILKVDGSKLVTNIGACAVPWPTSAATGTGYPKGTIAVRARHASIYVGDIDGVPTLMFDPDAGGDEPGEPLAEFVEDFQVALGVDTDDDKTIKDVGAAADDDEWIYNVDGDKLPVGGTVRAVRITVISRAAAQAGAVADYKRPAAEDRKEGSADVYRRRVLRTTVEIRNIGGSP